MSIEPTEKTAMPTITICLNSMHSRGFKAPIEKFDFLEFNWFFVERLEKYGRENIGQYHDKFIGTI